MVVLNDEDRLTLRRFADLEELCQKRKSPQFSAFLDPKEVMLFEKVYKASPFVKTSAFGGFDDSERKVAGFFPDFWEEDLSEFPVSVIKITGFGSYGHRDFLGSLLGLGIKRSTLGDIVIEGENGYVFALSSVCDFLMMNITKIGRQNVRCELLAPKDVTTEPRKFDEIFGTVASLRLDAIVTLATRASRSKAVSLIEKELVSVNWSPVTNPAKMVSEGDVLSVRGFGRVRIGEIYGESKKGRIKILLLADK